ncbi:histidinol dehydrogenase [Persicobacter psychrovividus]|uniref:Histidinol dehydrogenase n=1 Tax=Persicobacter psychrovividus TaxID=387638 RepID=A0ABM7VFX7_9BACT|nr:histidinol dehydrogenase [Persicobacter psychrovividus]
MKTYIEPKSADWAQILQRPTMDLSVIYDQVNPILETVKQEGDAALKTYAERFDGVKLETLWVSAQEMEAAQSKVDEGLKDAIRLAAKNIERFHAAQARPTLEVSPMEGVRCWRKGVAIEKVGLYIPGGTAPLFSTVLMLGIPAKLAGCAEIVLATPPNKEGEIHPAILFTAKLLGIDKIVKAGGAQAIGALAYGTESVPAVYKIFGPGNQYVTAAKQLVSQSAGVAIDMPAGPSEVLVYADATANADFIASDLLSQAEHGVDSQVVLVTNEEAVVKEVQEALDRQLATLPRAEIAEKALGNSMAIVLKDLEQAIRLINVYGPEHLILQSESQYKIAERIINAGSVFIGAYTPESAGDYASGTNHTLPTNGYARNHSGVSLDSYLKQITFQEITEEGLKNIGPAIEKMAASEELQAHKQAVTLRLNYLNSK